MTVTIEEATQVITVDQADLTFVTGTLYELDTNAYRLAVGALLASERYMWMDPAFNHNGEVSVAGTTFARIIEQTNGYALTFENLTYSVRLAGSNNNLFDVENGILNQNLVQVIAQNSAGLVAVSGAGDTASIASAVWNKPQSAHTTPGTFGKYLDSEVSAAGGAVDLDAVADAVWDEAQAGHTTADTFGEYLDALVSAAGGGGSGGATVSEIWGADPTTNTAIDTMGRLLLTASEGATTAELEELLNTYLAILRAAGPFVVDRYPAMSADNVHVNDLAIILDVPVQRDGEVADLADTTSIVFRIQTPDSSTYVDKAGAAHATDAGVATWTSDSDVFTERGNWLVSVRVTWNDGAERWTDTYAVQVLPVLPATD